MPDSIEYLDSKNINGLNSYCYCNNNPIMYSDEFGHFPILAVLIGAGFGNLKIGKHGLSTVYEKMYKKLGFETLEKGLSYSYDAIVGFAF